MSHVFSLFSNLSNANVWTMAMVEKPSRDFIPITTIYPKPWPLYIEITIGGRNVPHWEDDTVEIIPGRLYIEISHLYRDASILDEPKESHKPKQERNLKFENIF